jgi:hypothetical protein
MVSIPRNIISHNITSSTDHKNPDSLSQGSWFSYLLNHIPGYGWVKNKVGKMIFGQTFGMSSLELDAWTRSQTHEYQLNLLQKEREAEFKAAKYMALIHPAWYWFKYIECFEKGTEERKRAVLLFVLSNKEMYGTYYGRHGLHLEWLNQEFLEMGMRVDSFLQETTGASNEQNVEPRELQKRTQEGIWQQLYDLNFNMFNEIERDIERSNISMLNPNKAYSSRSRKTARRREFTVSNQVFWSDARPADS